MALIGILLLMLIKLLLYMKDLKEFRKFENEKKKSKWAEVRHHSELFVQTEIAVTHFRLVSYYFCLLDSCNSDTTFQSTKTKLFLQKHLIPVGITITWIKNPRPSAPVHSE